MLKFIFAFVTFLATTSQAREFRNLKFADEVTVGATTLKLNGVAVRKAMSVITVYVGAMYLAAPSNNEEAILNSDTPKQIIFHYRYGVDKNKIVDALKEGFDK